jgi:hypothetical protein
LNRGPAQYVAYDQTPPQEQTDVTALDFERPGGRHVAGTIVDEILSVVQQAVDIRLEPYRHMVSTIVPALDEVRTVEVVWAELARLYFSSKKMSNEINVVDSGSTDGTPEAAPRSMRSGCTHREGLAEAPPSDTGSTRRAAT